MLYNAMHCVSFSGRRLEEVKMRKSREMARCTWYTSKRMISNTKIETKRLNSLERKKEILPGRGLVKLDTVYNFSVGRVVKEAHWNRLQH